MRRQIVALVLGVCLLGFAMSVTEASAETFTTLDDPLAVYGTFALGISGNNIVGYYQDASRQGHGFIYNGSTYTPVSSPIGSPAFPTSISGNNIVGYYGDPSSGYAVGFLYNGTTYTTLHDLQGVDGTVPAGISGTNVVGSYFDSSYTAHGFLYNGSTYATLDDPLATTTYPMGISGNNIVGYYDDSSDNTHGFVYNGSTFSTLDDPLGVTFPAAVSGNNVVGYYMTNYPSGIWHGFETTIPEPSTFVLLGVGGLCLLAYAWRKRSRTA